jgi:hypothetical protein
MATPLTAKAFSSRNALFAVRLSLGLVGAEPFSHLPIARFARRHVALHAQTLAHPPCCVLPANAASRPRQKTRCGCDWIPSARKAVALHKDERSRPGPSQRSARGSASPLLCDKCIGQRQLLRSAHGHPLPRMPRPRLLGRGLGPVPRFPWGRSSAYCLASGPGGIRSYRGAAGSKPLRPVRNRPFCQVARVART